MVQDLCEEDKQGPIKDIKHIYIWIFFSLWTHRKKSHFSNITQNQNKNEKLFI